MRSAMPQPCIGSSCSALSTSMSSVPWRRSPRSFVICLPSIVERRIVDRPFDCPGEPHLSISGATSSVSTRAVIAPRRATRAATLWSSSLRSARLRQIHHDVRVEADELVQGLFQDTFLIAVRAEALRAFLAVGHRSNPIALDAARAHLRHVGAASEHDGHGGYVVHALRPRLEELK